jgi:hypothetical protein
MQNRALIANLRAAFLVVPASLLLAGCSLAIPGPASASPTPALGEALRQNLGNLQLCLEGSSTPLDPTNAVCYQGFSYTLDGYTWPAAVTQTVALLRSSGLALAQCLSGATPSSCGPDLAAFTTAQNELLAAVP